MYKWAIFMSGKVLKLYIFCKVITSTTPFNPLGARKTKGNNS